MILIDKEAMKNIQNEAYTFTKIQLYTFYNLALCYSQQHFGLVYLANITINNRHIPLSRIVIWNNEKPF